ncbi:MAG: GFA family protein [Betaproteobacteria bacterium]|nr:GFA family protein [Betaproteobacteria bacterium]
MNETHSGGCACGAVRYRVHGKPTVATVCHCKFCQRRLASAFAVIASFEEKSVEMLQGKLAEVEHRSDESGRWLRMSFCHACGTTISHIAERRPGIRSIAAGTFDDPSWVEIGRHIWVQSKLPWVSIPAGVEVYQKGVTGAPPPGSSAPVKR